MTSANLRVGDEVRFRLAGRIVVGKVREDRGSIRIGRRRLYLIAYEMGKDNPYTIELSRDEIETVDPRREPA
jgi:hypothetical protein